MKIYVLPVTSPFCPEAQPFRYPAHNEDYGVEQDFDRYLGVNSELRTNNIAEADWHYLGIYWTRWHLKHNYGQAGREELQAEIDRVIINDHKTFTICQYDDGPLANIGRTTMFLASRKTEKGIDIPLLSTVHRKPLLPPRKRFRASFAGRLNTHPIRREMGEALQDREDVYIYDGDRGSSFFVRQALKSWIALAPRGYGGSSFRFFEAMNLGVVPFLIGELDTRPFKRVIDWDQLSLYCDVASDLNRLLDLFDIEHLNNMGKECARVFTERLGYQKWCRYVIEELWSLV